MRDFGYEKIAQNIKILRKLCTKWYDGYDNWSPFDRPIDVTESRGVWTYVLKQLLKQCYNLVEIKSIELISLTNRSRDSFMYQRTRAEEKKISLQRFSGISLVKLGTIFKCLIRGQNGTKGIWFSYSTPKHSFLFQQREIESKIQNSGQCVECVLCENTKETRDHLFFSCSYAAGIWKELPQRLLNNNYLDGLDWLHCSTT